MKIHLKLFSIITRTCFSLILLTLFSTAIYADERVPFNENWRFQKDDPSGAEGKLAYEKTKDWIRTTGNEYALTSDAVKSARPAGNLGEDVSYTNANYDDSAWRQLNLPHDWAIEGDFIKELSGETGKRPVCGNRLVSQTFYRFKCRQRQADLHRF